jgi:hypothetical protein
MLDSLVRVSRRVGQVTDRFATDPESAGIAAATVRPRSAGTDNSPHQSKTDARDDDYPTRPRVSSSVRRRANAFRVYNAATIARTATFPGDF